MCVRPDGWIESMRCRGLKVTYVDLGAIHPSSSTLPLQSYMLFASMLQAGKHGPFGNSSSTLASVEPTAVLYSKSNPQRTANMILNPTRAGRLASQRSSRLLYRLLGNNFHAMNLIFRSEPGLGLIWLLLLGNIVTHCACVLDVLSFSCCRGCHTDHKQLITQLPN